jgi:hypothetical protein
MAMALFVVFDDERFLMLAVSIEKCVGRGAADPAQC